MGFDSSGVGDSTGEAQHGQACSQIGIWAAISAIMRMAASAGPADSLLISVRDVELGELVVRLSLQIKEECRSALPSSGDGSSTVDTDGRIPSEDQGWLPVVGDYNQQRFAEPFSTQMAVTQVMASPACANHAVDALLAVPPHGLRHLETDDDVGGADDEFGQAEELADPGAVLVGPPMDVPLKLSDLGPEKEFFAKGFGANGTMLLQGTSASPPIVDDRHYLAKLLKLGRDEIKLSKVVDLMQFNYKGGNPKRLGTAVTRSLLQAASAVCPRVLVFEDGAVKFRIISQEKSAQVKAHNELMRAAGVTLREFSGARVQFLQGTVRPCPAAPASSAPRASEPSHASAVGFQMHGT
jgi:hypothetical protein